MIADAAQSALKVFLAGLLFGGLRSSIMFTVHTQENVIVERFGKFARVALGTALIDYNGRFCMSSAAAATNRTFGIDRGLPFPLADIAAAQITRLLQAAFSGDARILQ